MRVGRHNGRVKLVLPLVLIAALAATAHAAVKSTAGNYLLLHPAATIETDLGGKCARLTNLSDGLVYVPLTEEPLAEVAKAFPHVLEVKDCVRQ